MKRSISFILVLLVVAYAGTFEERIERILAEQKILGLSLAILANKEVVYSNGFGLREVTQRLPMQKDTVMRIASISKTFTTLSTMILVDEGTYFQYSNLAIAVLGTLVEKVSGQRFDLFVRENILDRIRAQKNAGLNVDSFVDVQNLAAIYRMVNGQWVSQVDDYHGKLPQPRDFSDYEIGANAIVFGPQGGMRINMPDLAKYMQSYMNRSLLKPQIYEEMFRPVWEYNGANGDTEGGLWQAYGIGIHTARGVPHQDYVLLPGEPMKGHIGFAYGLAADFYFHESNGIGVVFGINGCETEYPHGVNSTFLRVEEEIFAAVEQYLQEKGFRGTAPQSQTFLP